MLKTQKMKKDSQKIKLITGISIACLLMTIVPSFLVFLGLITSDLNKLLMLCGTIGWFATAPFWMNPKKEKDIPVS